MKDRVNREDMNSVCAFRTKPRLSKRREKNAFRKLDNGSLVHGRQERRYVRWFIACVDVP